MQYRFYFYFLTLVLSLGSSLSAYAETEDALQKISARACESSSDIVLIVHKGKIIGCFGERKAYTPFDTRSITKTFLSLATGLLMQEKNFCGVDAPIYNYYPEWNQGIKKDVTIRHLLNHTSGLQSDEDVTSCYNYRDIIQMALVSDFTTYPGCAFKYNNKGTNLLAGVIHRSTGMSVNDYLRGRLLSPLGIQSDTWLCDTVGNNYGMSHLTMNAMDLAKIGMLIAQNGFWNGYPYLSKAWIDYMKTPSQTFTPFYGALVWLGYYTLDLYWDQALLNTYRACGVPTAYVDALDSLQGRVLPLEGCVNYGTYRELCAYHLSPVFGSYEAVYDFLTIIETAGLPLASWNEGHLMTIAARGYLGQQLIIFPDEQLIGVRLAANCGTSGTVDTFADFESLLAELIYQMNLDNQAKVMD